MSLGKGSQSLHAACVTGVPVPSLFLQDPLCSHAFDPSTREAGCEFKVNLVYRVGSWRSKKKKKKKQDPFLLWLLRTEIVMKMENAQVLFPQHHKTGSSWFPGLMIGVGKVQMRKGGSTQTLPSFSFIEVRRVSCALSL